MKQVKVEKKPTTLFYTAWILMVVNICFANSNADKYSTPVFSYISIVLLLLKIVLQGKYSWKQLVVMVLMMVMGAISAVQTADMRVLWFVFVLVASKNIDFERTVRYTCKTMLICCVCFILMHCMGVIEGTEIVSVRGIRRSLGLGHPNMCSAYYIIIMIQFIYLQYDKVKVWHIMLIEVGAIVVYQITKSNTGFLVTTLSLFMVFCMKHFQMKKLNSKVIVVGLTLGIIVFTLAPIMYTDALTAIDTLMTGRLHQAYYYYAKYGIRFFGNDVNYDLTRWSTDNILDIGYTKMLLNNGLFYYLLVVGGYIISIFRAVEKNRRDLIALMGCMIIYMFTENVATYIFMNVSMLIFSDFFYHNIGLEKEKVVSKYGK